MILKFLLVAAVIGVVYFIFFKKKPSTSKLSKSTKEDASEMIECANCGVFVELNETILSNAKYYCSKECVEKAK